MLVLFGASRRLQVFELVETLVSFLRLPRRMRSQCFMCLIERPCSQINRFFELKLNTRTTQNRQLDPHSTFPQTSKLSKYLATACARMQSIRLLTSVERNKHEMLYEEEAMELDRP
jgi:hypothetical protein